MENENEILRSEIINFQNLLEQEKTKTNILQNKNDNLKKHGVNLSNSLKYFQNELQQRELEIDQLDDYINSLNEKINGMLNTSFEDLDENEIKHIDLDVFRKLYAEISSHYYSNPAEKIKKLNTIKKILMYFDPNSEITLWKRYASRFIYSMVYIHYSKKVDIVKFIEIFHEDVQAYIQNMISKMEKRFRNSYDSESKILSVLKKQLIEDEKIIL